MNAARWRQQWQRLHQAAGVFRVVTLPLAAVATGATLARLYNYWSPKDYAHWYLYSISVGTFKEPKYSGLWVQNKGMTEIVKQALVLHPNIQGMTLISGLQASGKTSNVLMECHKSGRMGFFLNLGDYKSNKNDLDKITAFITESLIENDVAIDHSFYQKVKQWFFPRPDPSCVWKVFKTVCENHAEDNLVLVVDETQVLANSAAQHSGILNEFCAISSSASVILISSEFSVPQYFKNMTHIEKRTITVYAPTATPEEMLPHVRERFGEKDAQKIVEALGGSFELLVRLDTQRERGIEGVRNWRKEQLVNALELERRGMASEERATRTGNAMLAAASLAFDDAPLTALGKDTLELAQVGVAKVETMGDNCQASWANSLMHDIMMELICDKAIHIIMQKRVPSELYKEFMATIEGRCPASR